MIRTTYWSLNSENKARKFRFRYLVTFPYVRCAVLFSVKAVMEPQRQWIMDE